MATYSAALLKVNTLTANGDSAVINAKNVNATTVNTTNMNATNLGFTNLECEGTLSVIGQSTLGHTNVTGTLDVSGDLIFSKLVYGNGEDDSLTSTEFSTLVDKVNNGSGISIPKNPTSVTFNKLAYLQDDSNKTPDLVSRADFWTNATMDMNNDDDSITREAVVYKEITKTGTALQKTNGSSGETVVIGQICDGSGNIYIDQSGNTVVSGWTDGTTLVKLANPSVTFGDNYNTLFMVTQFESIDRNNPLSGSNLSPINIITIKQNKNTGELTAVSAHNVDTTGVKGVVYTCAASLTPWNTHLSSEEYPQNSWAWYCYVNNIQFKKPDGSPYSSWGNDYAFPTFLKLNQEMFGKYDSSGDTMISPYNWGWIPEITVNPNGTGSIVKHYSMGRFSQELAVVMPDNKTVLFGNDSPCGSLYMYIADIPGNLTQGKLYAAKLKQTSESNGGSFTIQWILLGHASDAEVAAYVETATGGDMYDLQARDANGGYTDETGYHPKTDDGYIKSRCFFEYALSGEQIYMKYTGSDIKKFAFLETMRCAEWFGATCETQKLEGCTVNIKDKVAYYAMSSVDSFGVMTADTYGESDDMHVSTLTSGVVMKALLGGSFSTIQGSSRNTTFVEEEIDSDWVPYLLSGMPELCGSSADGALNAYLGETASATKPANPDNLKFSEKLRTLFISEDTSLRSNNLLWSFNVDTLVSSNILSTPLGAESTGLGIYDDINGHSYCTTSFQHIGDYIPSATLTYFGGNNVVNQALVDRWGADYKSISSIGYISSIPYIPNDLNLSNTIPYQNVIRFLSGKIYTFYYNDFIDSYIVGGGNISCSALTYQFNSNQTISNIANPLKNGGTGYYDRTDILNCPYTIIALPTITTGAVIQFEYLSKMFNLNYNRYITITFSPDFNYIVDFKDTLPPSIVTRLQVIDNIVSGITQTDLTSVNFNQRLASSYATNGTGITPELVDSSGYISQYLNPSTGTLTKIDASSIFTRFGSVWNRENKKAIKTALLAASRDILGSFGLNGLQLTNMYEIMATFLINNRTITPIYQSRSVNSKYIEMPINSKPSNNIKICGAVVNCNYASGAPESSQPYHDNSFIYSMDMSGHNFEKRLNGTSQNSNFEPSEVTWNGHACLIIEELADNYGNKYLTNQAVRGMDTVLIHHRHFIDPAEVNYISGRTVTYARHHLGLLNDTFWYPNGPEINFNVSNTLSVNKVIINGFEIPQYLVQRRSIDPVINTDYEKLFINIGDAIESIPGLTINYVTDASGNYNTPDDSSGIYIESGLNKIEIWYQGIIQNGNLSYNASFDRGANLFWNPSSKGIFKSNTTSEMGNLNMLKNLKNNKLLDSSGYFSVPYTPYSTALPLYPVASGVSIRFDDASGAFYANGKYYPDLHSELTDSCVDYSPADPFETQLQYLLPISTSVYDEFYLQLEILCPANYYAHSGGTHLPEVTTFDGKYKLFRFVPGAKVSGPDYRSCYETAFKWDVTAHPWIDAGYVDTSGGTHVKVYSGISGAAYNYYENNSNVYNLITKTGIKNSLDSIETFLGPYPFDTFAYGFSKYTGMEHREAITQNDGDIGTVIHETIHMWFQNKISQSSNKVAWIDEGLTTYLEGFSLDNLYRDGKNRAYYFAIQQWITEVSEGLGNNSIRDNYGFDYTLTYLRGAYIFSILGYNWGAPLSVNALSGGKKIVRLLDASNNIIMNISNSSGTTIGPYGGRMESFSQPFDIGYNAEVDTAGFISGWNRKMLDNSGNVFYVTSGYKILDASGIDTANTASYSYGLLDDTGIIMDDLNLSTLTDYTAVTLPQYGGLTNYFKTFDTDNNLNINVPFWDAMKSIIATFSGTTYTYESWVEAWAVYAADNYNSWKDLSGNNQWPYTKEHIYDFFNELCNTGSNLDLSSVYRIALDNGAGGLLPSTINPDSYSKVPLSIILNGRSDLLIYPFFWFYGITKYLNVRAPMAWLTRDGINPLFGASPAEYDESAAYYGNGFSWEGKVVLISRGVVVAAQKMGVATIAGCTGFVFYNNTGTTIPAYLSVSSFYNITVANCSISRNDGLSLAAACLASPTKTVPAVMSGIFNVSG